MVGTYKPTRTTDRTISFELKDGVAIYTGFVVIQFAHGTQFGNECHNFER